MIPDEREITEIIQNNLTDDLICRALEMRPEEIVKYICGLANVNGGYILIGVVRDNGILNAVGFQLAFDMKTVMGDVSKKLKGSIFYEYGHIRAVGKNIFAIKVDKLKQNVLVNDVYYRYKNNNIEVCQISKEEPSTLFISYTECDTPIVDIIEKKISERLKDKIKISRYTNLEYKDNFKIFMDTIQDHDFVLTVVSDTYLRRQACMYEVGEIIKNHHYQDKLLFVVLTEKERKYYGKNAPEKIEADIYKGAVSKLEYTKYWQKKYEELEEAMKQINDYEATRQATDDLQIIGQIYRKDIGEFLQFLSDENGKNFQKLYDNDFEELIKWIYS
ncbi:MAG: putative DNA binding domain-containing protein [Bacteroides sp.]|nr:putative DNA binding domain-containing protein [Bacteroides sp.]MCM1548868.1 putative DNA binding domain-containing protein [Clostridium sp.]